MAYNPRGLFRNYIDTYHKEDLTRVRSSHQQSKVSIDYHQFNQYLLDNSGKDFWDGKMYTFIEAMEEYYNANTITIYRFVGKSKGRKYYGII